MNTDSPKELENITDAAEENDEVLQAFADKHQAVLLAFVGSYVPRRYGPTEYAWASMTLKDEFSIEKALTTILNGHDGKLPKLYLLLNSPGGWVASSFKIALAIRRCFDDITVFVPHTAASGGTMLALIGNRIRMGMMSNLGPLDVQVPYKDTFVSANSPLMAESDLAERVAKKRPDELSYLEKHLVDMLDPVIQTEMENVGNMEETYMEKVLTEAGYGKDAQEKIIESLVFKLPTHEFVIQRDLAQEIGIKVENSDTAPDEWGVMRRWFWQYVTKATDKHVVRWVVPKKKDAS